MVVAAFRATLEEIDESRMILHVVDITHPNAGAQADVVVRFLKELDLADKPQLLILNKTDLLADDVTKSRPSDLFDMLGPRSVFTSAINGSGLDALHKEIEEILSQKSEKRPASNPSNVALQ